MYKIGKPINLDWINRVELVSLLIIGAIFSGNEITGFDFRRKKKK